MRVKLKCFFVRIAAALATAALGAPPAEGPVIEPNVFPDSDGWLGGDSAYSILLDKSSALWLFGDTFVGKDRQGAKMIHNSIAIRSCRDGCTLSYAWSGMHSGKPDSFFRTPQPSYYWSLDGFTYQDKLYIFLEQMHSTGKGGAFGFDYSGVTLATISNFTAEPERWVISCRNVSSGNQVVPGIAAAISTEPDERFVYVFTLFRRSAAQPFLGLIRDQLILSSGTAYQRGQLLGRLTGQLIVQIAALGAGKAISALAAPLRSAPIPEAASLADATGAYNADAFVTQALGAVTEPVWRDVTSTPSSLRTALAAAEPQSAVEVFEIYQGVKGLPELARDAAQLSSGLIAQCRSLTSAQFAEAASVQQTLSPMQFSLLATPRISARSKCESAGNRIWKERN